MFQKYLKDDINHTCLYVINKVHFPKNISRAKKWSWLIERCSLAAPRAKYSYSKYVVGILYSSSIPECLICSLILMLFYAVLGLVLVSAALLWLVTAAPASAISLSHLLQPLSSGLNLRNTGLNNEIMSLWFLNIVSFFT